MEDKYVKLFYSNESLMEAAIRICETINKAEDPIGKECFPDDFEEWCNYFGE